MYNKCISQNYIIEMLSLMFKLKKIQSRGFFLQYCVIQNRQNTE